MLKTRLQSDIAARLKLTAKARGLTYGQVAVRMKASATTVYRWWRGERGPPEEVLERYAQIVQVPFEFLLYGAAGVLEKDKDDLRVLIASLVHHGWDAEAAYRAVMGDTSESAISDQERQVLNQTAGEMRTLLDLHSGGRWDLLTTEQQIAVLNLIEAIAKGNERTS